MKLDAWFGNLKVTKLFVITDAWFEKSEKLECNLYIMHVIHLKDNEIWYIFTVHKMTRNIEQSIFKGT